MDTHGEITLVYLQAHRGKSKLGFVFLFSIISLVIDQIVVCPVSGVSITVPARPERGRDACLRSAAVWAGTGLGSQGHHKPTGTALAFSLSCATNTFLSAQQSVCPSGSAPLSRQCSAPARTVPSAPRPRHSGKQPPTSAAVSLPGRLHLLATRDFYLLNPRLTGWQK